MHTCCFQGEKYNDEDPNALDLFKECHYSQKKKGYTPYVQSVIVSILLYLALTRSSLCILCVVLTFELIFYLLIGCAKRNVP
jgi:hypothetical protein